MEYDGETGYLPTRLLNAYAEFMWKDHDRNNIISDVDVPLPTPSPPSLSTVSNEVPKASIYHRDQPQKLQVAPEILKFLHLRQQLVRNLEWGTPPFSTRELWSHTWRY